MASIHLHIAAGRELLAFVIFDQNSQLAWLISLEGKLNIGILAHANIGVSIKHDLIVEFCYHLADEKSRTTGR